jgi:transcriptional regulator with XRE-family HTH domain
MPPRYGFVPLSHLGLQNSQEPGMLTCVADIESLVRARLRALRQQRGWSLDELARRAHLSASTLSRIETGKRSIGLDVLVALAQALAADVDQLLAGDDDTDVVIRPTPTGMGSATVWPLSRPGASTTAVKIRYEPTDRRPKPKVHPGHDWMFVLDGTIELTLGERRITVETGEAASFSTMTPHAVAAVGRPAEVLMLFDHDGQRTHLGKSE